jgi:hypothetical protein
VVAAAFGAALNAAITAHPATVEDARALLAAEPGGGPDAAVREPGRGLLARCKRAVQAQTGRLHCALYRQIGHPADAPLRRLRQAYSRAALAGRDDRQSTC